MVDITLKIVNLFPVAMIVMGIFASIVYGIVGDYPRCIYWALASAITFTVTFLPFK